MNGLNNVIDKVKKNLSSMGAIISTRYNDQKQIISKKSLDCVQILIKYLKRNAQYAGIFQVGGRRVWISKIYKLILNGNTFRLEKLLEDEGDGFVLESACALRMFLMNLKTPLIPEHIQALVLGDNNDVASEIVARDVLGLIRQDMKGRQLSLLTQILDLLHYVCKHSTTNELTGSYMPVQMLPIFFQLTYENMVLWRRIASIFEEIIREAPTILETIPTYDSISEIDQQPSGQIFRFNKQHPVMVSSDININTRGRPELMLGEHFDNNINNNDNANQRRRIEVNFIYSQFVFYTGDRFPYSPRTSLGKLNPIIRRNRDRLMGQMNQIS